MPRSRLKEWAKCPQQRCAAHGIDTSFCPGWRKARTLTQLELDAETQRRPLPRSVVAVRACQFGGLGPAHHQLANLGFVEGQRVRAEACSRSDFSQ